MRQKNFYLYLTAFAGGLASLAVEMSASTLLRAYFGTANLVWATIIGLILLFLAVGYFIGGRWADRSPESSTLYQIVAWAGMLIGVIPFAARPALVLVAPAFARFDAVLIGGSFLVVLILFSVPVTLMGCVSPFIIRLAMKTKAVEQAGETAGRVYAISTAGSFLGAFLPNLILVPLVGTRNTFVILSLFLLTVAFGGLMHCAPRRVLTHLWMPIVVILLAFFLRGQPVKAAEDAIYETESAYNYIQVVEDRDGCRRLLLNEGQGIHSVYCPRELRTNGPWDYFLIAPYFNPPPYTPDRVESVALVGLAAGTMARQYTAVYGPIPIDGIEIDPEIVRVGREYFGLTPSDYPNVNVIVADGRYALAHSERRYTVIGVDAYRLPYIPPHLTTVEFFQEARDHLTDDGVVVINVGHTPDDYRLVEAMLTTLRQVFPSTHVLDVPDSFNAVIVATVQPTQSGNLCLNLPNLEGNDFLYHTALLGAANLNFVQPGDVVFTDDRATIEWMTNALVLEFILKGF